MERFAGRYVLLRPLGEGAMGRVHLVLDTATGEERALKRLLDSPGAAAAAALRHEFELLARIRHPAVVQVHELGFAPDGAPFYTMEYVPGLAADRVVAPGDWRAACAIGADVARGLEALHAAGIVHGDLKPSNVLVAPASSPGARAEVRLVDFGLASLLSRDRAGHRGTPGYAAPEIVRGDPPAIASDLYSLGALLHRLIVGEADAPGRRRDAASIEEAGVPPALARLVLRLLAPAPAERCADAREARRALEAAHPEARRSPAERLRGDRVVGRARELARLERWMGSGPPLMLLSGPEGIGRSALLAELAGRAALAGRPIFRLAPGAAPGAAARALCAQLASAAGAGEEPAAGGRDPEVLARAAVSLADRLARGGAEPVVLVDDAERLDPLTRAFVRHAALVPEARAPRWLVVLSEPGGEERVLCDADRASALALEPLDGAGIESLVAARLGETPPRDLAPLIAARSGGHPGLAVELLRLAFDRAALDRLPPEGGFVGTRLTRLDGLSRGARETAAALAAWGRPVSIEELRAAAPRASAAALDELRAAGLVFPGAERLALCAPALGDAVLDRLGEAERAPLHEAILAAGTLSEAERFEHLRAMGRAGEALGAAEAALEAGADDSLACAAADLATWAVPAEAPAWQERAGRRLVARGRHGEAIPYLDRALAGATGEARWACSWLLAGACLRAGRLEQAGDVARDALATAPPPRMRALLLAVEASRRMHLRDYEGARATAIEARRTAIEACDDRALGAAALALGGALMSSGRVAEAEPCAEESRAACARAGDVNGEARALGQQAVAASLAGDAERAEALHRGAIEIARAHGLRHALEENLMNLGGAFVQLGRWLDARESYAEASRIALEDGRARSAARALYNLSVCDGLVGRPGPALSEARASLRLARSSDPASVPGALRALAQGLRISGRPGKARAVARRASALALEGAPPGEADWCRIEYVRACALAGAWGEVAAIAERGFAACSSSPGPAPVVLACFAGRAALRRHDADGAAAWAADAERILARRKLPYAVAHLRQLRAERALAAGEMREAVRLAREALEGYEALPAPADRALAVLDLAHLARTRRPDALAEISGWLDEAAESLGRLGDHRRRERALALEVESLRRSRPAVRGGGREQDLLRAVSRLLDSLSDVRELGRRAMELVVEQLEAERGVLLLADERTGDLIPLVEHGAVDAEMRDEAVRYSRRIVERVRRSGKGLLVGDAPSDPEWRGGSRGDLGLRSLLCVPVHVRGRVMGAVYLDSRQAEAFSPSDRGLLEGFAHLVAIAIERHRGERDERRELDLLVDENLSLRRAAGTRFQPSGLVATSESMQQVLSMVERAAQTSTTVLITGENGTGKELLARVLHHSGRRREGPFVAVNCGAIPEPLLESELFGILPNVATGVRGRDGRFVQANGGTLFLDEIGEMPLAQQVALLSVLSNREVTPVGGGRPVPVDVRIIAASNLDLRKRVEEGAFREDLFYRLNVIPIEVPPLRERKADIPALAQHFAAHFGEQQQRDAPKLSPEFLAAVMRSDWPGNVRELQNYMERMVAMTTGRVLHPDPLPRELEAQGPRIKLGRNRRLKDQVEELERKLIREAMDRCKGNQTRAARELGLTEQSLRYRLRGYGIAGTRRTRRTRRNRR